MKLIATSFGLYLILPTGERFEGTDGTGMDVEQLEAVLTRLSGEPSEPRPRGATSTVEVLQ